MKSARSVGNGLRLVRTVRVGCANLSAYAAKGLTAAELAQLCEAGKAAFVRTLLVVGCGSYEVTLSNGKDLLRPVQPR